jgi:hypothetical protein
MATAHFVQISRALAGSSAAKSITIETIALLFRLGLEHCGAWIFPAAKPPVICHPLEFSFAMDVRTAAKPSRARLRVAGKSLALKLP